MLKCNGITKNKDIKMKIKKLISPALLLLAAVLWGFAFVMQKAATTVPTFTLLAARGFTAVIALTPSVVLFDKLSGTNRRLFGYNEGRFSVGISKRELLFGTLCGSLLFIASALQQAGIADTDAGKTSFITALYVVIVPIYALLFGKRSPINAWVGIGIAVVGFYLLCIKDGFAIAPSDILVILCAFVFAMQIMAVDIALVKCDGVRLSLVQFTAFSILSFITALIFERPFATDAMADAIPEILYLGICSSGIAYTLQIIGQKNTAPAVASIILSLESVFGALFSAIVLYERMSVKEYIGCTAVLLAVVISQLDLKSIAVKKQNKTIDQPPHTEN